MTLRLFDTHLLLWAAYEPVRLPTDARSLLENPSVTPYFSAATIWEVAIKAALGREDFTVDAAVFRRALLESGYRELAITGAHAAAVAQLPRLHADPFDRILIAQARIEGVPLVTADARLAGYGPPTVLVAG